MPTEGAIQYHLSKQQFNNVIRMIKLADVHKIRQLKHMTYNKLKEFKIKRNKSLAIKKIPNGSDQFNVYAVIEWINKIKPEHTEAKKQLRVLDATLCSRLEH